MTAPVRHRYRVFKASWGLAVDISGYVVRAGEFGGETEPLPHGASIAVLEPDLRDEELGHLLRGARLSAPALAAGAPRTLVVTSVAFNICDFQPEALFPAVVGLVEELLGAEVASIPVRFDSHANRYEFDFPD